MPRNRKQRALVVAVAAVAATAAGGGTAAAERPAARKAPQATVDRLVVPRSVTAHWERMTASARVRLRARGPARLAVSFHLSRDRRLDRRDHRLGTVRTRRLARGRAATVRLRTTVSSALGFGRWNVLACVGASARRRCAVAAITVLRPGSDVIDDGPPREPGPPPPPSPQKPPPRTIFSAAPVLQLDDGVAWGVLRRADGSQVGPGDTVTTTLRLGASVKGSYYHYSSQDRQIGDPETGRETVLLDAATAPPGADLDEGAVAARLPFAFPLAGVETGEISISTNGWLSTAGPAWSSGRDWREDYRGDAAIGANLAAIAPLWEDLTLTGPAGSAPGRIVLVEPPSGDRVAIRWEAYPAAGDPATERGLQVFEATLWRGGSIDFSYPTRGALPAGFAPTIGLSPGVTGREPLMTTETGTPEYGRSYYVQPEPLPDYAPGIEVIDAAAAGTATLTLPRGSIYVGGSPGCRLAVAATLATAGRVDCDTPQIPERSQATVDVSWTYPPLFVGAVTQQAAWTTGSSTETADAELLNGHYRDAAGATLAVTPDATAEGSRPGLEIEALPPTGSVFKLRDPLLTGTLPTGLRIAALRAGGVRVDGAELRAACPLLPDGAAGGTFACRLPNGLGLSFLATVVLEQPASGAYPVTVALEADNLPAPVQDSATLVIP